MKKILLITILLTYFGCKNTSEVIADTTTYYFIRHAEKDKSDITNRNPKLIEKGLERAENWKQYFKNINLDAVYSTNYFRTKQTAQPTANEKNLEIIIYNPNDIDYEAFKKKTKNQKVLIVGHSNTTPAFVNKIIGEDKYESIDETINSKLFIVTIDREKVTSKIIDVN